MVYAPSSGVSGSLLIAMISELMDLRVDGPKDSAANDAGGSGIGAVLRHGLSRSLASLVIKIATAGLTYLMFVIVSRSMGDLAYGRFAFGFSLATVLAIGASMGQQTAILRYWPEDIGRGDPEGARGALKSGWALTLIAGAVLSVLLIVPAFVYGAMGPGLDSVMHLMAAGLLILPLGAAEFGSSALRAQGSVWTALMPRDILWRFFVPLVVWGFAMAGLQLSGAAALALAAAILALAMGLQFILGAMRGYYSAIGFGTLGDYWRRRGEASRWFLAGTVIDSAGLNIDIVLIGLFVAAESAGLYFNAFRTAGLITLFMFAITLVIAPMVSKHYHGGDMAKAQAITTFCAWAGFLFSIGVFVVFVGFGDLILGLFGETYSDGKLILIILSIGLLADAATGPSRIVMMMTGHERQYVMLFGGIMIAGLAVQAIVIPLFGVLAAAVVNAATRTIGQFAIAIWSRRHIGIDTSLLGLWLLLPGKSGVVGGSEPVRHS